LHTFLGSDPFVNFVSGECFNERTNEWHPGEKWEGRNRQNRLMVNLLQQIAGYYKMSCQTPKSDGFSNSFFQKRAALEWRASNKLHTVKDFDVDQSSINNADSVSPPQEKVFDGDTDNLKA
jgi:hypothetical protein